MIIGSNEPVLEDETDETDDGEDDERSAVNDGVYCRGVASLDKS